MSDSRSSWVDYAKCIGVILVVYGHCVRGIIKAGLVEDDSIFVYLDSIIYSFHMPLFFFLSGLFFEGSLKRNGSKKFMLSKVDTLVYPYFLWSIFQGGVEIYLSALTNGNKTIDNLLGIWVEPIAQFWFLYCLFFSFLFLWAARSISFGRGFLLIVSAILYLSIENYSAPSVIEYFSYHFVFFVLGVVCYKQALSLKTSFSKLLIVVTLFMVLQVGAHNLGFIYTDKGWGSAVLAAIGILMTVLVSKELAKANIEVIGVLGKASMCIYLMHILATSGVRIILHKSFGVDAVWIHVVVGILAGVMLPYLAFYIIQKYNIKYVISAPLSRKFLS